MNKIYRVIWSKVRNCYVVVAEIAKAHSKGGSAVHRVLRMDAVLTTMLLASVLSFGSSVPVWANDPVVVNVGDTIQAGEGIGFSVAASGNDGKTITISADETLQYLNEYTQFNKNYAVNVMTDGKVASGDSGIVTGDTVYKETRVEKDGNYIKKDNTAAENITALDEKVKDNATGIEKLNNEFNNTYNQMNRLDDRMRKGLAGAAALAALHPMDFDPDDKLQFSAGVGNYRSETAAAIGAFYRPNEKVMSSIGGTFGNSDNLINAGITFGLDGNRNRIPRSRNAMAHEIVELKEQIAKQNEQIARQDEQIAKLTELVNKLAKAE